MMFSACVVFDLFVGVALVCGLRLGVCALVF